MRKSQGFTLIELLIVIAIIGILAAVLIPNLLAARNRANDTVAQTYLRDAVTVQEIYHIDNNEYAEDPDDLTDLGLKPIPTSVTFTIHNANATTYCMSATHAGGSGVTFYATPATGVTTNACTASSSQNPPQNNE